MRLSDRPYNCLLSILTVCVLRARVCVCVSVSTALDSSPLLTSGQREARRQADLLARLAAHRRSVIRVQFPDRLVLQVSRCILVVDVHYTN